MDDVVANLALLTMELPDADQQLFPLSLGIFEPFGKLPMEIRLMVWRAALPRPCIVHLETECVWAQATPFNRRFWEQKNAPPYPVCLYVNRESRTETLKHYRLVPVIFKEPDTRNAIESKRSICIGITRDLIVAPDMYLNLWFYQSIYVEFDLGGGGFEGVRYLVLGDFDSLDFIDPDLFDRVILSNFPSLTKLAMLAGDDLWEGFITDTSKHGGERQRRIVELYMKDLAIHETGRTAPQVMLLPKQKIDLAFWQKLVEN